MKSDEKLSRRGMLRTIGAAGASATLGGTAVSREAAARDRRATALAIVGDRWHNFDYIRTSLTRTLVEGAGVPIDFTPDYTRMSNNGLKGRKLLIVLMDGMIFPDGYTSPYALFEDKDIKMVSDPPFPAMNKPHVMWITGEQGRDLRTWVEKGGSAWFFHNASYISGANEDFRHVEGALFTGHTPVRPYRMEIVNPDHPITRGVRDFVITEEQHFLTYDKDPAHVLARSVNDDGLEFEGSGGNQGSTCEACWAYDYGRGRVCFMAPGHTIPTFWNPEYVKLQQNAVRWLLRETG